MLSRHRPPPRQRALLHRLSRQFDELASAINALKAENEHLRAVAEAARRMTAEVRKQSTLEDYYGQLYDRTMEVESALETAGYLKESVHGNIWTGDGTTDTDRPR